MTAASRTMEGPQSLAELDPALPPPPRSLDASAAAASWSLHDAEWIPGERMRLAYRLLPGPGRSTFVAVDVTPDGWVQYDYRDDPVLEGLADAADPGQAAETVASFAGGVPPACHVEPVRYRPGSRCVLRYDVAQVGGSAVYAKVYSPDLFSDVSATAARLADVPALAGTLPTLRAVRPERRMLLADAVGGRTLSPVLADSGVPQAERERLAEGLGGTLARFHAQSQVVAARRTAADRVGDLDGALGAVRTVDPRLGRRLDAALDLLASSLPGPAPDVLTHGGFRAGQVVVDERGRLVLLDLDGVCRCSAGRDLGSALAHLTWRGVRHPQTRSLCRDAEHAFLAGYVAGHGEMDDRTVRWWYLAGLLMVAARRYRRLEQASWATVGALTDHIEELAALVTAASRATEPVLAGLRAAFSPADGEQRFEIASVEMLASAHRRRSVYRYVVRDLDGGGPVPLIGKTFVESHRARTTYENLVRLFEGPFDGRTTLRVPEPVGILPEHRTVVYRAIDGVPLDTISDPASAEEGLRGAALWLAQLHRSDVSLSRHFSLDVEQRNTLGWADLIAEELPHLAEQARRLAEGWASDARGAGVATDVPIHKDLHASHVLVGDGITVIDLDEARHGDPSFDLAHFNAYLELGSGLRCMTARLRSVFTTAYVAATGWRAGSSYAAYSAYTCLKIAKQWAVGAGPGRGASEQVRRRGAERALAMGQSWLTA